MLLINRLAATLMILAYEGEGDAAAAAAAEAARKAAEEAAKNKGFTQDDVNRMMAEERRKTKVQSDKIMAELEAVKGKATLSTQEREELEQRLEQLRSETMTKEELAKQQIDKLRKEGDAKLANALKDAETWRTRHTAELISRSLTDAAVANEAYNPGQIVAQLSPNTRLVEELDEQNKPNGRFVVKVKITEKDKEGKEITLDLPVTEAVKKLSDKEDFANLFKGKGVGGLGGQNRAGKELDLEHIAKTDPALYRKLRSEGKLKL